MFTRKLTKSWAYLEILAPYLNNPSEESLFGSNKIKEQNETMELQNEDIMLKSSWLMNWFRPVYKWETSQKAICIIVYHCHKQNWNISCLQTFFMNVLLNMYICALRKKIAPHVPERKAKCTHLAPYQTHRGNQAR